MPVLHIPHLNLPLIMDSGQCFRMTRKDADTFHLIARGRALTIRRVGSDDYLFDCPEEDLERVWRAYFDLDRDYPAIYRAIPEDDPFLSAAKGYGAGLRILRQDPFETLISFIISQRKTIPAIRRCVDQLARLCGREIAPGCFAFPDARRLDAQPLDALRRCGLGYRARYVQDSARMIASGEISLRAIQALEDGALMRALTRLPGVGGKVAGCVMLFAYARFDAFPRDVWINRVIDQVYGGRFDPGRYRGHAGFIQQLMFCYGRGTRAINMQEYKEKTGS